ncbi:helix-turn-helix domain-containing protein [Singulisphaera rosea]
MAPSATESRYLELVRQFPLRPIRSDEELAAAIAQIDSLHPLEGNASPLTQDESDYEDVLSTLIHEYEAVHDPLPSMTPHEALQFIMSENGLTLRALAEQTGLPLAILGAVASGKRPMSPRVREALCKRFRVLPELFI